MPILKLENVSKSYITNQYNINAVNNVTLSFYKKEAVAVVGPSGSGKSTLLNLIGLIMNPDSGNILIDEKIVSGISDYRRSVFRNKNFGYIAQDFALIADETVYNNIKIPLIYNKEIKQNEYRDRIEEAATSLGIQDKLYKKVAKLSGGERQRVSISRAIVCDQPIILADEPTGSLDTRNKEIVMDIFLRLCEEKSKSIIIVTHDFSIAERCNRIIRMKDGEVYSREI
ncbi:ABC transporter ATP-binding protein [Youngiibacter multivorans]|uniref:ABC transport system ATP-binding protein n=1 Tax=Youngiibacter multivorans TaxID=937251 RepID=A0ABS4G2C8_9CLOT|nr:ABC transporter ATP-binding protein [Youngiibacter multivorans]MBP1918500.1 putative ABC transport system ATP-binding protein [Youngiibacter multivorans]